MRPTLLLGAASFLFRNRKARVILVGIQLGYLIYKLVQEEQDQKLHPVKTLKEKSHNR